MDETNKEYMGMLKSFTETTGTSSTLVNVPVLSEPTLVETNLTKLPPMHVTTTNQIGLKENKINQGPLGQDLHAWIMGRKGLKVIVLSPCCVKEGYRKWRLPLKG